MSSRAHGADEAPNVWTLYGEPVSSRLLLGTSLYPSPDIMRRWVKGCRREHAHRFAAPRE